MIVVVAKQLTLTHILIFFEIPNRDIQRKRQCELEDVRVRKLSVLEYTHTFSHAGVMDQFDRTACLCSGKINGQIMTETNESSLTLAHTLNPLHIHMYIHMQVQYVCTFAYSAQTCEHTEETVDSGVGII